MNINHAQILGRLTKNPELRKTQGGADVCSFSLATNRKWTDKTGAKQEESEFHNCVAWNKLAELIAQYMTKGCELLVEGRLQTRSWDDKTGSKRYATEIVVENMQFGAKPGNRTSPDREAQSFSKKDEEVPVINLDEEPAAEADQIPF